MILGIQQKKVRWLCIVTLLFLTITVIIFADNRRLPQQFVSLDVKSAPVLMIDAGHGGLDGGAVGVNAVLESDINLALAEKLECLAQFFGYGVLMTRERAELDYPEELSTIREKKVWDQKRRVEMINRCDGAVLISIHQNNYPDSRPRGPQVFYAATEGSLQLAEELNDLLSSALAPDSRRLAAPISKKIYLMNQVHCTAVLVECGFLSNPDEARQLTEDPYQRKLAMLLLRGYGTYVAEAREAA